MNTKKPSTAFRPYLLNASEHRDLCEYPLDGLLSLVQHHKLVVLRGFEALSREGLLHYCQSQAKLLSWDFGPVMEMKVDAHTQNYLFTNGDVPLHWDGAFHQEPKYLLFHCLQAPTLYSGGETLFVDTEMIWESASTLQKEQWFEYALEFKTEKLAHYGGQITKRLVQQHPIKGNTILRFAEPVGDEYLNPVSVQVLDKTTHESSLIISTLSELMRNPLNSYFHQWQQGDYLIADNFSLLHGRNPFINHSPRHLRRIQIL